jgi:hypothetical protein
MKCVAQSAASLSRFEAYSSKQPGRHPGKLVIHANFCVSATVTHRMATHLCHLCVQVRFNWLSVLSRIDG